MSAVIVEPKQAAASVAWAPIADSDGARIVLPGQTPQGQHILSALLKRSYAITPDRVCTRAAQDQPLTPGDVFWDTPMNSSVRLESDFVPFKLQTDVVLIGRVHAPGGRPTAQCEVSLQIADRIKRIRITGDRRACFTGKDTTPSFTEPEPFTDMGLRYERAYGGTDVYSDKNCPYPYPRNPLGSGFAVLNTAESVDGLLLPNLEDPANLLPPERLCIRDYAKWVEQPQPMGFGWFPKSWQPRCALAGILPADRATERELRAAYAKLLPADQREAYLKHGLPDMDFAFFNGASPGLSLPFLEGGETVVTENLSREGRLSFRLPADTPGIALDVGTGIEAPQVVLHTVLIRLEEREVDLVWRAALPYPGRDWLPQMKRLQIFTRPVR